LTASEWSRKASERPEVDQDVLSGWRLTVMDDSDGVFSRDKDEKRKIGGDFNAGSIFFLSTAIHFLTKNQN